MDDEIYFILFVCRHPATSPLRYVLKSSGAGGGIEKKGMSFFFGGGTFSLRTLMIGAKLQLTACPE